MKSKVIICILMSIALLNTASAAGEGGVNIEPVVEETIFSEITHTETSTVLLDCSHQETQDDIENHYHEGTVLLVLFWLFWALDVTKVFVRIFFWVILSW